MFMTFSENVSFVIKSKCKAVTSNSRLVFPAALSASSKVLQQIVTELPVNVLYLSQPFFKTIEKKLLKMFHNLVHLFKFT